MIDTENLTKKFGDSTAGDSVTLHVDEGEVFGFLGPSARARQLLLFFGISTAVLMVLVQVSSTIRHVTKERKHG
jgi:ABC-type transporter Mla maintaining outer membrane lipid asymmetry ATPase subunit MlaF